MTTLFVAVENDLAPAESLGATRYMMEAVARGRTEQAPWLLLSFPTDAALTLGRYQNELNTVSMEPCNEKELPVLRRLSGGTTALVGTGLLHAALAIHSENFPLECEPRQFLQKYGAVLIRALVELGFRARYHGRDLISIQERPVGLISFEIDNTGTALLESVLAVEKPFRPETALVGYPQPAREDPPTDTYATLQSEKGELTGEQVAEAVQKAASEITGFEPEQRNFTALERERIRSLLHKVEVPEPAAAPVPSYMKSWSSKLVEESIGVVEATVRVTQGRFIKEVNIHGDFMSDSPGVEELEQRLRMCPIKRRQVALIIDDVLGAPEHVILGIRRLGSILEAIMDAAKKATDQAED
jgi:lipoate-protein ligase A